MRSKNTGDSSLETSVALVLSKPCFFLPDKVANIYIRHAVEWSLGADRWRENKVSIFGRHILEIVEGDYWRKPGVLAVQSDVIARVAVTPRSGHFEGDFYCWQATFSVSPTLS